jgi:hypothetical protein
MHIKRSIFPLCFLLLAVTGCKRSTTTQLSEGSPAAASPANQQSGEAYFDVCGLITKEEIKAVMGSPIKDTKSSGRSDGSFRVSQCFYTATEFSKSVSLAVTQSDPNSPAKRSPKDFWKETFGRYSGEEKEREEDKEKKESLRDQARARGEEEKAAPPKKIDGIGDEAYSTSNRFGGALYVLKKDVFIRIGVGGPDKEETKIHKSKALAQKALERL